MSNASNRNPSSSTSSGSSSSSLSPPTSPLRSSPSTSNFQPSKTSGKKRTSPKKVSEVCDSCKKKKRRCDLKEPCGSCQSRDLNCTYKRYSLSIKFPQLHSDDLNIVSQLLIQLDESKDSKTTTSLKSALRNISKRLGISLKDMVSASGDEEESEESNDEEMDDSDQDETIDESNFASSTMLDNESSMKIDYESYQPVPYTRRQTRSSIKLAPLSIPASPSPRTGAYPAPLPPSSTQVISPMRYHFPGLFLSQ